MSFASGRVNAETSQKLWKLQNTYKPHPQDSFCDRGWKGRGCAHDQFDKKLTKTNEFTKNPQISGRDARFSINF